MYFFFLSSVKQLAFTEVPNPPPPPHKMTKACSSNITVLHTDEINSKQYFKNR